MIVSVMARAAQQLIDTSATVAVHESLPGPIQEVLLRMGHRLVVLTQIAGVMNVAALDLTTGQTTSGSAVAGPEGASTTSLQADYRQMGATGGQ